MYHFFVTPDQVKDGYCMITGGDVNHIRNVLRMKAGDQIAVRDGISRNYLCCLETIDAGEIRARILSEEEGRELPARLWLFQGLPKGDKMELIIQKAVELGAYRIIPVATRRAVVKLDPKKAEAKTRRWNAIAESAAKQCGRSFIPEVGEVMDFSGACGLAERELDLNLIPYELAEGMAETKELLRQARPGMQVGIFIGPEGGFDAEEIQKAQEAGIRPITLGRRILRTETAGMAVLAVLMFHLEG